MSAISLLLNNVVIGDYWLLLKQAWPLALCPCASGTWFAWRKCARV